MPDQHHLWIAVATLVAAALCLALLRPARPADKVGRIQWRPETTGSRRKDPKSTRGWAALNGLGLAILAAVAVTGVLMFLDVLPSSP